MALAADLENFVTTCQALEGDEKGEAQTFLNRFFQVFGYADAIAAGATFEERVSRGSAAGKTGFADLVWKPRVLIEMKKRGTDLSKHYAQALQYWTNLVPNRPRYVLLCNFDQFWIYDFNVQVDTPVDVIELEQLPARISAFGFMEVGNRSPVFRNNQVEITEKAARRMGELYKSLRSRSEKAGFSLLQAQRFLLQCVLAMFAEDRGLLPTAIFIKSVQDCLAGGSTYDILGGLFREMNTSGKTPAGRYQGVDYFNGGLFAQVQPIELVKEELRLLDVAAREDWSKVRPAIFGNIFESTADADERHARGMHFTSEVDIMKIIRPTISRFWEDQIEAATTISELNQLQLQLQQYRVLDPACGSGNFLYLAYQELKRIEVMLLDKIATKRRTPITQQISFVTPNQFYGLDTNPFAVELARVTLMIGRKIAIDKHDLTESALPLDTLDQNIVCADALFTPWPKADAIIGNPPFLGGKHLRLNLGDDYINKIFKQFPTVKDVDFCSYWFRLAHQNLPENGRAGLVGTNSISQGKSRTAALDYIAQNNGVIHDAISTQEWSGEAAVHVSIVNWIKRPSPQANLPQEEGDPIGGRARQIPRVLLERARELRQRQTPAEQILWECLRNRGLANAKFRRQHNLGSYIADFYCHQARLVVELDGPIHEDRKDYDQRRDQWMQEHGLTVLRFKNDEVFANLSDVLDQITRHLLPPNKLPSPTGRGAGGEVHISCYLDSQPVPFITSSLRSTVDLTIAKRLTANLNKCFQGVIQNGKGFIVTEQQVKSWMKHDPKNKNVLKLFLGGSDLTDIPHGCPSRWIIDFADMSLEEVSQYQKPLEWLKNTIPQERANNRNQKLKTYWWKYEGKRLEMRIVLESLSFYFAVTEVSKWSIFLPCQKNWLPSNLVHPVASDDFYVLGILTSKLHRAWVKAQSSTLKGDTRYTHNTCFETFPFPQTATPAQVQAIRATMQKLHDYRTQQMEQKKWGITKLYNAYFDEPASQLYQLHAQLDQQVLAAYGFNSNADLLAELLALNLELAAKESRGEPIKGPTA